MAQRLVTVEELFHHFGALMDFVCADESENNEVVVTLPPGNEAVVIVPHARLVALRLALETHRKHVRREMPD